MKKKTASYFELFEWDERKRRSNIERHGIDFEDAAAIFSSRILIRRSDRASEVRYVAIGILDDVEIVVVYTVRIGKCRIISARRAKINERKAYHKAISEQPPERAN